MTSKIQRKTKPKEVYLSGLILALKDDRDDQNRPLQKDLPLFRCMFCHQRLFHGPVIYKKDDHYEVSGAASAHFYTTHGYDPEIFISMVIKAIDNIKYTNT